MSHRTIVGSIIFTWPLNSGNAETANQGFGIAELVEAAIPLNDMFRKGGKRARLAMRSLPSSASHKRWRQLCQKLSLNIVANTNGQLMHCARHLIMYDANAEL